MSKQWGTRENVAKYFTRLATALALIWGVLILVEVVTYPGVTRPSSDTRLVLHVITDSCDDIELPVLERHTIHTSIWGSKSNLVIPVILHEEPCIESEENALRVMTTRERDDWDGRIVLQSGRNENESQRFVTERKYFLRIDHQHRWLGEIDLRAPLPTYRIPAENQMLSAELADRQRCRSKRKVTDYPITWVTRIMLLASGGECGAAWEHAYLDTFKAR